MGIFLVYLWTQWTDFAILVSFIWASLQLFSAPLKLRPYGAIQICLLLLLFLLSLRHLTVVPPKFNMASKSRKFWTIFIDPSQNRSIAHRTEMVQLSGLQNKLHTLQMTELSCPDIWYLSLPCLLRSCQEFGTQNVSKQKMGKSGANYCKTAEDRAIVPRGGK